MRVTYLVQFTISDEWLTRKAKRRKLTVAALAEECRNDVANSLSDALAYKDYSSGLARGRQ